MAVTVCHFWKFGVLGGLRVQNGAKNAKNGIHECRPVTVGAHISETVEDFLTIFFLKFQKFYPLQKSLGTGSWENGLKGSKKSKYKKWDLKTQKSPKIA